MAHYNVNSGVPKTLIQHLIRWVELSGQFSVDVSQTLRVILVAEISPELVPVDEGERSQSTEAAIGPYALQDFNLYYTRGSDFARRRSPSWRCTPGKQARREIGRPVCRPISGNIYELADIRQWLEVFLRRFFAFSQCRTARRSQRVARYHQGAIGELRPMATLPRGWRI